ncbi:MAG: hypothetical protein IT303_05715 [Dehalococcoidia bacterium]|nr:hypothetical protein [Dehalococcoidia bacterium]
MTVVTKDQIREIVDQLPDEISWDDLLRRLYIRSRIEQGLKDIREGRVYTDEEFWAHFGLTGED